MKITLSELRNIIRDVVRECYGWPVEAEHSLYGTPNKMGTKNPTDPKNKNLKLPKGHNSRSNMNESFQAISSRELSAWKDGNYDFVNEAEETQDPCDKCGGLFPSTQLIRVESDYLCKGCR